MTPTVLRSGAYRFFFYSNEGREPPHIHIQRDRNLAKFWLQPVSLASSSGFGGPELRRLEHLVERHGESLLETWHEFFRS
jgi:hypothetical protein